MAANNSNKLVVKRNQLYVPGNVSVKSESIERHGPCVFKIENHVNKTTGSGFLCKIKIEVDGQQRYLVGMMTCAHVMPDVRDDKLKQLKNYAITFERGPNSDQAARQLDECVLRAINMTDDGLDALFLIVKETMEQFWTKNLRVKDVVDTARNNIYTKGRQFFSMGHPGGGQLKVGTGYIGSQTDTDVLVSHNMNTDDGNSGAPIIDLQTESFIAIHKGVLDLSQCTHEDKDNYPNCAVKIIPVIKYIELYYDKNLGPSYLYTEVDNDLDRATIKYPANNGLPPAVASLDPAHYQPLPTDPPCFTWLRPWKDAMNKKRGDLTDSFKFGFNMFDTLREKNVITHEQHESITAEHQPYKKARIMYDALENSEPRTIRLFIAILRKNDINALADEVQDTYDTAMREAEK